MIQTIVEERANLAVRWSKFADFYSGSSRGQAVTIALLVAVLLVLILMRVPIAIAMLIPSIVHLFLNDISIRVAIQQSVGGIESFPLLAVPLFVLVATLANSSGITDRLFDFAEAIFGSIRGALGYVNVLVSVMFSWMSGSAMADAAGLGAMQVPSMIRRGYSPDFSVGLTASSALIGPLMPPSIAAILYAVTTQLSIGALFTAGVVPAFCLALLLSVNVYLYGKKHASLRGERRSLPEVAAKAVPATPAFAMPVIILGGILGGVFTPTEAAGVAVLYLLVLTAFYRKATVRVTASAVTSASRTTAGILVIVASASIFGWILRFEGAGRVVSQAITGVTDNPFLFLLVINIVLLLAGTFLEPASAILILAPILHPLALEFGIDPLHFAIIFLLNLSIGLLTPPVGILLFVVSKATNLAVGTVIRGVLPFYVTLLAALLVITYMPWISLAVPSLLGFP